MTSKLIVNSLAADTGVSTITFADQAKMGNSLFHSTGFTIGDSFLHSTGVNLTNINATGVITATKFVGEVSVGSSITFEDNEKAYFGTGTDFSIYHNGSASYLDETGTGGLIVKTDTAFQVFNSAGSQPAFTVTPGGGIDLYHNTTKMLETTSIGLTINGDVKIIDGENLRLGTGNDLLIYHASNHSYLENSTGELRINNTSGSDMILKSTGRVQLQVANGEKAVYCDNNGAVELYHNNVKKFETTSAGADFTLASGGQVNLYHLGSDGGLRISGPQSASSATLFFNTNHQNVTGGTDYYTIQCGGANHTLMFKRGDTSGNTVFELDDTQHVRIPQDNKALKIGAGQDLQLSHNGSHSYIINNTGALIIQAANSNEIQLNGNGQHAAKFNPTGTSYIYYNGSVRFSISATNTVHSEDFVPGADNTYDLGQSSYRWRNIYTADLHCSNRGSSNDVDGTWGDYTIQEGESDLFLINNRSGKKYKFNLTEVS